MNRLPDEQDGEQADCWGHSVSLTQFLVFRLFLIYFH